MKEHSNVFFAYFLCTNTTELFVLVIFSSCRRSGLIGWVMIRVHAYNLVG